MTANNVSFFSSYEGIRDDTNGPNPSLKTPLTLKLQMSPFFCPARVPSPSENGGVGPNLAESFGVFSRKVVQGRCLRSSIVGVLGGIFLVCMPFLFFRFSLSCFLFSLPYFCLSWRTLEVPFFSLLNEVPNLGRFFFYYPRALFVYIPVDTRKLEVNIRKYADVEVKRAIDTELCFFMQCQRAFQMLKSS